MTHAGGLQRTATCLSILEAAGRTTSEPVTYYAYLSISRLGGRHNPSLELPTSRLCHVLYMPTLMWCEETPASHLKAATARPPLRSSIACSPAGRYRRVPAGVAPHCGHGMMGFSQDLDNLSILLDCMPLLSLLFCPCHFLPSCLYISGISGMVSNDTIARACRATTRRVTRRAHSAQCGRAANIGGGGWADGRYARTPRRHRRRSGGVSASQYCSSLPLPRCRIRATPLQGGCLPHAPTNALVVCCGWTGGLTRPLVCCRCSERVPSMTPAFSDDPLLLPIRYRLRCRSADLPPSRLLIRQFC